MFFPYKGQFYEAKTYRKIRDYLDKVDSRRCMFCVSVAKRHMKDCPTLQKDFDPNMHPQLELDGTVITDTFDYDYRRNERKRTRKIRLAQRERGYPKRGSLSGVYGTRPTPRGV